MNSLDEQIRRAIRSEGQISFARFMELALYCPVHGYYEQERDTTGRAGDYYTNVNTGRLFGELLAFQFAQWVSETAYNNRQLAETVPVQFVEAGAHDGRLAADILTWLQEHRPKTSRQLGYWIIEPSVRRQILQRENLRNFARKVVWFDSWKALPKAGVRGVIFSNELLDAMPVHRLGWDATRRVWFEWAVTVREGAFVWTRMPANTVGRDNDSAPIGWPDLQPELLAVMPDNFTTEICPLAENWWRQAASALRRGKLLTIDYGLTAEQFFTPERKEGTLRAYYRHRLSNDLLANVGAQDITAHVNLTSIQRAGETAGLKTEMCATQAQFLTDISQRAWQEGSGCGAWTSEHTRQFQTLTHPEQLGRAFRVLVQER